MNLKNFKITNRGLYWGLIITFAILYLCVGFVSTLHSITFFNLANNLGLAILLGLTYEVGQASVLFSILMSEKNKGKFLPWTLMILLTALQVTANVYASFKFMVQGGSTDWQFWQKSILFGVQASTPEMYQVIISWIAGALLPVVALGMTALVAQNMNFMKEENEQKEIEPKTEPEKTQEEKLQESKEIEELVKDYVNEEDDFPQPNDDLINAVKKYDEIDKLSTLIPKEAVSSKIVKPQLEFTMSKEEVDPVSGYSIFKNKNTLPDFKFTPHSTWDISDQKYAIEPFDISQGLKDTVEILKSSQENIKDLIDENPKLKESYDNLETSIQEFKDFIEPDKPEKKRGRPPKTEKMAAASKKEQEPLQNEDVKVPKKKHRISNPLNTKGNKPELIKHIEQINPTSKGEELIESLKDEVKLIEDSAPIEQPIVVETPSPEPLKEYKEGIEVVDVKAVPVKKK